MSEKHFYESPSLERIIAQAGLAGTSKGNLVLLFMGKGA